MCLYQSSLDDGHEVPQDRSVNESVAVNEGMQIL